MTLPRSADKSTAVLPTECVIENAQSLKAGLLEVLDDETITGVDVSSVERIDLSGIQILAAAMTTEPKGGRIVGFRGSFGKSASESIALSGYESRFADFWR